MLHEVVRIQWTAIRGAIPFFFLLPIGEVLSCIVLRRIQNALDL